MNQNNRDELLKYLEKAKSPKSIFEICQELGISNTTARKIINELEKEDKVIKTMKSFVKDETLIIKDYYFAVNEENINQQLADRYSEFESAMNIKYAEIDRKVESFSNEILTKYIELLGIFVSIFSVVLIDTNALIVLLKNHYGICRNIILIVAINITLATAILILTLCIGKILNRKKCNNED